MARIQARVQPMLPQRELTCLHYRRRPLPHTSTTGIAARMRISLVCLLGTTRHLVHDSGGRVNTCSILSPILSRIVTQIVLLISHRLLPGTNHR